MIARALGKTIRVGLGTAAVWGSIQGFLVVFGHFVNRFKKVTSELGVWGRDPQLALARVQEFVQWPSQKQD